MVGIHLVSRTDFGRPVHEIDPCTDERESYPEQQRYAFPQHQAAKAYPEQRCQESE